MHPTIHEYLVKSSQNDALRAAERHRLVLETRHVRRASAHQSKHSLPGLPSFGRRVLAVLSARSS
jgi:hypothetical protein